MDSQGEAFFDVVEHWSHDQGRSIVGKWFQYQLLTASAKTTVTEIKMEANTKACVFQPVLIGYCG